MVIGDPTSRSGKMRAHILDVGQRIVATKGFSQVGLNELLAAASVPKGSFYYYFASKEAFGKALIEHYFTKDLAQIDELFAPENGSARDRLFRYWEFFRANQENDEPDGKCLAVKLGAEIADMSEDMRLALNAGTESIISLLSELLDEGIRDGSLAIRDVPSSAARTIYQLWMGASLMWKISHDRAAFDNADSATRQTVLLGTV